MDGTQTVLDLVEQIYDTAEDANIWGKFLHALSDALRGTAATIIVHDVLRAEGGAGFAVRFDSDRQGERHAAAEPSLFGACTHSSAQPALARIGDGWHPNDSGNILRCHHSDRRTEIVLGSAGSILIEDAPSYAILIRRQGVEPFASGDLSARRRCTTPRAWR
jgi:hypothetical protein